MTGPSTPHVRVVGAGLGGLTLGIALASAGVEVDLHERAPELREIGAAVALSANGTRLLDRLGVLDAIEPVATTPTDLIHRDGRTGAVAARCPGGDAYRARFGAPYLGIHRVPLQQALAARFVEVAGPGHLHLGCAVAAVASDADGAELTLDDGTVVRGDVVVGADGVHSTLREHVVGPGHAPRYTGTSGFRGLVPRAALPTLPDPLAIQFWMGPDAHLLHYALGADDETVNFLAVLCGPEAWTAGGSNTPAAPGELAAAFAGWHPAVLEMLDAVEQSPRWALLAQEPLPRWTRDRVVLLGDACHAMLPHHGQGANQSIEDAAVLAGLLVGHDPDEALRRYPRLRRGRTRAVARNSWETGTLLHLPDGPGAAARDAGLRDYADRFAWVHAHDATAVLDAHPAAAGVA